MIQIDQEKCTGCGLCESLCSNVFKLNSEAGKAEVMSQAVGECDVQNVIDSCPNTAISQEVDDEDDEDDDLKTDDFNLPDDMSDGSNDMMNDE